jgi:hypothetical protein
MKQNLLLLAFLLPALAFAQNVHTVKKKLSHSLIERYSALENNKKVKHGIYEVINDNNKVLVRGNYNNGAKEGVWDFFSDNGQLIQKYDFTKGILVHYAEDSLSIVKSSYELFNKPGKEDTIDIPYKIGGDIYQLNLLYSQKNIPQDIISDKLNVVMTYILTISEKGKLEDWKVLYKGEQYDKTVQESIKNLPADAYEFSPALVNNVPVKSKLIYSVNLNYDQVTVPGNNNIMKHRSN